MTDLGKIPGYDLLRGPSSFTLALGDGCENCCCNCSVIGPRISPCTQCVSTPYPASAADFGVPPDWAITLSGITAGTATTAGGGTGCFYFGDCRDIVASDTSLYSGTFVIAPCQTYSVKNCFYMNCYKIDNSNPQVIYEHLINENFLTITHSISYISGFGGYHQVQIVLNSIMYYVRLRPDQGTSPLCDWVDSPVGSFTASTRGRTLTYRIPIPMVNVWRYDPAFCTEPCNETIQEGGCVATGSLMTLFSSSSTDSACRHALDFSGASAVVEAV